MVRPVMMSRKSAIDQLVSDPVIIADILVARLRIPMIP